MFAVKYPRATFAALASAVVLAGCGGDTVLGSPDVAACTAGSLSTGSTKSGAVSAESCLLWHDYNYEFYLSESWTIRTKANTVYIVRMVPVAADGGANTFDGEIAVYARNEAGDQSYATGYWGDYGTPNVNGGESQELIFSSPKATTVSLRVFAYSEAEVGSYELELIACSAERVEVGEAAVEQEFDDEGCALLTDGGQLPAPTPVRFWMFAGDADVSYTATFTRVSGTSNIRGRMRGPDLDFGCYTGSCIGSSTGTGAGPFNIIRTPSVDGVYTLAMYQQTAGTLTGSARVVTTPVVLMAPTAAQR
jgi:hypothetical protein